MHGLAVMMAQLWDWIKSKLFGARIESKTSQAGYENVSVVAGNSNNIHISKNGINQTPRGGRGGDATARDGGWAKAGSGGPAGDCGDGGDGGEAVADGPNSFAHSGDGGRGGVKKGGPGMKVRGEPGLSKYGGGGGEAPQSDGRGGRGGQAATPLLDSNGKPILLDGRLPGQGGRGGNTPIYNSRLAVINHLRQKFIEMRYPEAPGSKNAELSAP